MKEEFIKIVLLGLGVVGGIIGTITTKFAHEYLKIFFDEKRRKAKHIQNVAREVLIITNEANTYNYTEYPRSREHINSVLIDVESVDKEMGIVMNEFVELWIALRVQFRNKDMLNEIKEKREILKAWALRNR